MNDCIRLHSDGITHHHRPQSGLTEFLLPCHKSVSRSVLKAILEDRELGQTLGFDDRSESDTGKKKKILKKIPIITNAEILTHTLCQKPELMLLIFISHKCPKGNMEMEF